MSCTKLSHARVIKSVGCHRCRRQRYFMFLMYSNISKYRQYSALPRFSAAAERSSVVLGLQRLLSSCYHKTVDDTYLYPLSSVLEIWARQSRSWQFINRVTICTPCSITVRTCVVPASCEMTLCRVIASSTDMSFWCRCWLKLKRVAPIKKSITLIITCSLLLQHFKLPWRAALTLNIVGHCLRRRVCHRLAASLSLPQQPSPHHRLVSQ